MPKWATNNKLLRELMENEERKVKAKKNELKAKEEELRAQAEKLAKARVEVPQLEGELVRSCNAAVEVLALRAQLEAA